MDILKIQDSWLLNFCKIHKIRILDLCLLPFVLLTIFSTIVHKNKEMQQQRRKDHMTPMTIKLLLDKTSYRNDREFIIRML